MSPDANALHQTIFAALRSALGLSETDANIHLIRAYAEIPAPEPAPEMNLCYYFLQTDANAALLQETSTTGAIPRADSFIPCRLALVFYGTDCESWAHRVRTFLFLDGKSRPRAILRAAGLYPIPNPRPPSIVYEEIGKSWRKRADLVIDLRLQDSTAYGPILTPETPTPIDTITSAPSVEIHIQS